MLFWTLSISCLAAKLLRLIVGGVKDDWQPPRDIVCDLQSSTVSFTIIVHVLVNSAIIIALCPMKKDDTTFLPVTSPNIV